MLTRRAVAPGRIQEQNLRMEMPVASLYRSPSEWRDDWITRGWRIPIQAGWALSSTMETLGLMFPEAFDLLAAIGCGVAKFIGFDIDEVYLKVAREEIKRGVGAHDDKSD